LALETANICRKGHQFWSKGEGVRNLSRPYFLSKGNLPQKGIINKLMLNLNLKCQKVEKFLEF
jgi:hypothetical protein